MNICGVDEAGRGPVVGPLVMAAAMIHKDKEHVLAELGVKDSKQLTLLQRERLFDELQKHVQFEIIVVPAAEVDEYVLAEDHRNLNVLEMVKSVELVNRLKPNKAIIDSPSNNIGKYTADMKEMLLHLPVELVVEHKADENHLICAAASIFAKVTRDREIEKIKAEVGENFGSGYAADPRTIAFLNKHWKTHSHVFRKSWATYQNVVKREAQRGIGDF